MTLDLSINATNLSPRQIVDCDVTLAKEVNKEGSHGYLANQVPTYGRPISTGIEVDPRVSLRSLMSSRVCSAPSAASSMRGGRGKPGSTQAKRVRLTRLRNAQDYSDLSRPGPVLHRLGSLRYEDRP